MLVSPLVFSAATLLLGTGATSAFKLSEATSPLSAISIAKPNGGNDTYDSGSLIEYCRPLSLSAWGWSRPGPVNITLYDLPCETGSCKQIQQIATNIGQNDTIEWINDVPVNWPFELIYQQNGDIPGLSVRYLTIPPTSGGQACDQSRLKLPFSAESLSNTTELVGTPTYYAGSDALALVRGSAKGAAILALVAAGMAALL